MEFSLSRSKYWVQDDLYIGIQPVIWKSQLSRCTYPLKRVQLYYRSSYKFIIYSHDTVIYFCTEVVQNWWWQYVWYPTVACTGRLVVKNCSIIYNWNFYQEWFFIRWFRFLVQSSKLGLLKARDFWYKRNRVNQFKMIKYLILSHTQVDWFLSKSQALCHLFWYFCSFEK